MDARPRMLFSGPRGSVRVHPILGSCGMKAGGFFRLSPEDLIRLPDDTRLFTMPSRRAVGYDPSGGSFGAIERCAIGAFLPPGYTATYSCAYLEKGRPMTLPLFSYAAVAYHRGSYYASAVRVDDDRRHDASLIDIGIVRRNIRRLGAAFRSNRLVRQLEKCSLEYGCPNAQNFFLERYEAPLPTSPSCNASCAGCISQQTGSACPTQPRINFIPTPAEVAEIALHHIGNVRDALVSFGQGCEGEPLLQAALIEDSIRLIRRSTSKGIIHMNTNGSRPEALKKLFKAGLQSVRISTNSCREPFYDRYYKPRGYSFNHVLRSMAISKRYGSFVSLNYLTMPGFTDSKPEFAALRALIRKYGVDMIQWRNLNYDPLRYFEAISADVKISDMVGIREEMGLLRRQFPRLRMGYFNPRRLSPRAAASPHRSHRG